MSSDFPTGNETPARSDQIDLEARLNRRRLGIIIFALGVLFGMVLLGASVYADFESSLFDVSLNAESRTWSVHCPALLASYQSGVVMARINNRSDERVSRLVHINLSRGHLIMMQEDEQWITLLPGESQTLDWEITAEDAVYGRLILAKITILENTRTPLQKGSCGILVFNLPFGMPGWILVGLLAVLAVAGTLSGAALWWQNGRSYSGWQMEATQAIFLLSFVVIAGLLFSAIGIWVIAAIAFYIAVLVCGVMIPHFVINRKFD